MLSHQEKNKTTSNNLFFHFSKPTKINYAILSAMKEELALLREQLTLDETVKIDHFTFEIYRFDDQRIILAETGLGTTLAASMLAFIHAHFKPDYYFFCGVAGGFKSDLKIKDVVIIEHAFEAEIQSAFTLLKNTPFETCLTHPLTHEKLNPILSADETLLALTKHITCPDIKIHFGKTMTSNQFPAPNNTQQYLETYHPHCMDMETSAIYQTAAIFKIPTIAIRGISNLLDKNGKDENIHQSDLTGSASAAARVTLELIKSLTLKLTIKNSIEQKQETQADKEILNLINRFELQAHPEGGYYKRIFQSEDKVSLANNNKYQGETRYAGTAIYYLLNGAQKDFSAWHQLKSDELWHYHAGCSVNIYMINSTGELIIKKLGPIHDPHAEPLVAVPAEHWFAAEPIDKNTYSFMSCSVSPGFELKDFILANRKELIAEFPQHESIITRLTRIQPEKENKLNSESTLSFSR